MDGFLLEFEAIAADDAFSDELTPDEIGSNRLRVLRPIARIYPGSVALLWLLEHDRSGSQLRLSYIMRRGLPETNLFRGRYIKISDPLPGNEIYSEDVERVKKMSEEYTLELCPERTFTRCITLSKWLKSRSTSTCHLNCASIGVLIICGSQSVYSLEQSEIIITLVKHRIAAVIEMSRLRRVVTTTDSMSGLIRGQREAVSLIVSALSLIGAHIESEIILFCNLSAKLSIDDALEERPTVVKSTKQPYIKNIDKNTIANLKEIDVIRRLTEVEAAMLSKKMPATKIIRNGILVPIEQDVIILEDVLRFEKPSVIDKRLKKRSRVESIAIFANKMSSIYIGDWFSGTDIQIAQVVSSRVADILSRMEIEISRQTVSLFFEKQSELLAFDVKECYKFLRPWISGLRRIAFLTDIELNKDRISWSESTDSDVTVDGRLLEIIREHLDEKIINPQDRFRYRIGMSVVKGVAGTTALLFHIPTKSAHNNFLCFWCDGDIIGEIEWIVLRAFAQEFHIALAHRDTLRERVSSMAQVRHAVIGPLSACVMYLQSAVQAVGRVRRSDGAWKEFRTDSVIEEDLPHALQLAQQARVLADSARYLVSRNSKLQIVANQRLDIVKMVQDIKLALQFDLERKKLRWRFKTNILQVRKNTPASGGDIYGRRDMMWVAIYNLIENAVKYASMYADIQIEVSRERNFWRFSVSDEGVYIAEDQRVGIWEAYYRGTQEDNLNLRGGTGLGLYVTKLILNAHSEHAKYGVVSERMAAGKGAETEFFFELPMRPAKEGTR